MDGWYPNAKRLEITTSEYFDPMGGDPEGIVNHISDGDDSRGWLQNANNNSSVHFLIRIENGKAVVYQFMSVKRGAWGNGRYSDNNPHMPTWIKSLIAQNININRRTISIEHEGRYPQALPFPQVMIEASIKLQKWLCDNYPTIKRDRDHIIGHYQIDAVSRAFCPGGPGGKLFPFDTIIAALNAPATDPLPGVTVTQFRAFYLAEPKALQYFGLPIEASKQERLSDGNVYTVQYFERARFELHGDKVLLGLIGAELLAA